MCHGVHNVDNTLKYIPLIFVNATLKSVSALIDHGDLKLMMCIQSLLMFELQDFFFLHNIYFFCFGVCHHFQIL